MHKFYSNGKLLITGEYLVLDGAKAFALPTKFGQSLEVSPIEEEKLIWESYNSDQSIWYSAEFKFLNHQIKSTESSEISNRIVNIIHAATSLNEDFLSNNKGYKISTHLSFPKNWGLGTSSTLINNIANWAKVNPYQLLEKTFGGSGYDIACAQHNHPIFYKKEFNSPEVSEVDFNPNFKNHLFFVFLNKKQNSREGIAYYNANKSNITPIISEINDITNKLVLTEQLSEFESLLNQHESIISKTTKQVTVKERLFSDFEGCIKSLGAWGGDFVLVTSETNPTSYFKLKGYETIVPYSEMIL
ncbi:GYDIA family GHMP kinase [Aestuariibaculum sediminum]|uniref:GHMP kinase n=1 Tax=Aestuariibaculum sediminum TaxID=2770637 RepID=A0A8J6UH70_9FLAO|nr:GYDIA family GHMP kinase [Aestuariibaculum sediminum]MBD0832501.1 GHMP kinase [Aestuariibaculum sediminum]